LVIVITAITLSVSWMGAEPVINRVLGQSNNDTPSAEALFYSRGWIWRDAWSMFKAHPVTGVGLGAFGTVYPTFTESDNALSVTEAHNDYLQILSDGGLIGAALLIWFLVAVTQQMSAAMRSHDQLRAAIALGASAGIVGMLVHSFFDFNLQLPAQTMLFLLLMAIVAQCGAPPHSRSSA
jgi:O-antigen ligase